MSDVVFSDTERLDWILQRIIDDVNPAGLGLLLVILRMPREVFEMADRDEITPEKFRQIVDMLMRRAEGRKRK